MALQSWTYLDVQGEAGPGQATARAVRVTPRHAVIGHSDSPAEVMPWRRYATGLEDDGHADGCAGPDSDRVIAEFLLGSRGGRGIPIGTNEFISPMAPELPGARPMREDLGSDSDIGRPSRLDMARGKTDTEMADDELWRRARTESSTLTVRGPRKVP